ncbi:hypothetical protein GGU10DRAFT_275860, partial [Lentinula aff. detonsa]
YRLDEKKIKPQATLARSVNEPTDMETWHRRLAHAGLSRIENMIKGNLVSRLKVTKNDVAGKCIDCMMGKAIRRPFDADFQRESKIVERVHTDLTGPTRTPAKGGYSVCHALLYMTLGVSTVYKSASFELRKI